MKLLLLSVAVLFLAGTEGRSYWQQDKPHSGDWNIVHDSFSIIRDVVSSLKFAEIAEQYKIKEKLEQAKDNAGKIEAVLEGYVDVIRKKSDDVLVKHFPVFRKEVVPHLKAFDDKVEEELKKFFHDFLPAGSDFASGVRKHVGIFCDKLRKLAEEGRDNVRADFDALRSGIQPFADDIKAEYDKYRKEMEESIGDKIKRLKNELVHELEEIGEKLKPYVDNAKTQIEPQLHTAHEKIENLFKVLYEAVKQKLEQESQEQQQESA